MEWNIKIDLIYKKFKLFSEKFKLKNFPNFRKINKGMTRGKFKLKIDDFAL